MKKKLLFTLSVLVLAGTVCLFMGTSINGKRAKKSSKPCLESLIGKENIVDLLILGSGPAGTAAAVYGARANLYTVVLEGEEPGGLLAKTTEVENWIGEDVILGPDIPHKIKKQAERLGAHFLFDEAVAIDATQWPLVITTRKGTTIHALTLVVATGATPRKLGIEGEEEYAGRGVSSCAKCDGPFFKGLSVAVVGGGDSAAEEAMQLAAHAKEVSVFVRKDRMRAAMRMQNRLNAYPNITVHYNTQIRAIHGDENQVTSIEQYDLQTKKSTEISIDGLFVAIGHDPNSGLVRDSVECDEQGYILVQGRTQKTSHAAIFAAGDVEDHVYRQASVAAGSGVRAALDAVSFLMDVGINNAVKAKLHEQYFTI